jgi:uncharacterized cofD-like protein
MKKVVVIGGGTGTFTVLNGLRETPLEISAIVSTMDNGGSTGILRDELGVLPPGDMRQALLALSNDASTLRQLFEYRFDNGRLAGHSFGNLFLSALEKVTGSFDKAILEAGRVLAVQGQVIPVTTQKVHIHAEMDDGKCIHGEHAIEQEIWADRARVRKMWIEPKCKIHPMAKRAISEADAIVLAPGSIFTSLIPNLLVGGMKKALAATRAPIIFVVNLMTEKGQTDNFFVQDFVDLMHQYMGKRTIDYALYNTKLPDKKLLERYKREMERRPVKLDSNRTKKLAYKMVGLNLLGKAQKPNAAKSDKLSFSRSLIRHDPKKVASFVAALTNLSEMKKYFKTLRLR